MNGETMEYLQLVKELGVAGALLWAVLYKLIPVLKDIADTLKSYAARNDAHHAETHRKVDAGSCRAPASASMTVLPPIRAPRPAPPQPRGDASSSALGPM